MKSNKQNFQHLFFDLDNTLLDFDYASQMAFNDLLSHFNKEKTNAYETYKKVNAVVWSEFEKGKIDALELRKKRFDLFLNDMDWDGDGRLWNGVYLDFLIESIKFVEGAEELLIRLQDHYYIHIITNGLKEVQRPRIAAAQLDKIVTSITVSDEINLAKPNKDFFNYAITQAGIDNPDSVLVIGDNYNSDIIGAFNAGLKSCWYNRKNEPFNKEFKAHDYEVNFMGAIHPGILES